MYKNNPVTSVFFPYIYIYFPSALYRSDNIGIFVLIVFIYVFVNAYIIDTDNFCKLPGLPPTSNQYILYQFQQFNFMYNTNSYFKFLTYFFLFYSFLFLLVCKVIKIRLTPAALCLGLPDVLF